jgi:glycosyltransferase involved in cell wall biosynthesis
MVVQSVRQREVAVKLGIPTQRIVVLRPAVDTEFWEPYAERTPGARAIVGSVGIEHRDYATFVEAMEGLPARLVISIGSTLSPVSHARLPAVWPHNADVSFAPASRLRLRHADATVVVVPIVETEYPAGITSVLEAMAMAKPVVVSGTRGLDDVVKDGETGLVVPPGDAAAMHRAVRRLLEDHRLRRRLGMHARAFAVAEAGLDRFAARLAGHLGELVAGDAENWLPPVALAAHVR